MDLSVTAPAATLALTLMYLRTEDEGVLSYFAPPQSARELAAARPDLLMLRALGGALVAWGRTQPSVEWVERQLPPLAKVWESVGIMRGAWRRRVTVYTTSCPGGAPFWLSFAGPLCSAFVSHKRRKGP